MSTVEMREGSETRRARFESLAPGLIEPLRRYLRRRTDAATADDVLADTLLVCWRRLDELDDEPLPWAYGVARRCLANAERAERRQHRLAAKIASTDPPSEVPPAPVDDEPLARAWATLRPDEAELVRLWAWEQLTPAEIGTVLGITANAASIRLHRVRGKLGDALRKTEPAAGHERS